MKKLMKANLIIIGTLAFLFLINGGVSTASATTLTLTSNNSTLSIDPNGSDGLAGVTSWTVDSVDHLYNQWWWYRVGTSGGEASFDTLTLNSATGGGTSVAVLSFSGTGFDVTVIYSLLGGTAGSGASDYGEQIQITNTSGSALDFHLFEYNDFDLSNTPDDDTVTRVETSKMKQTDSTAEVAEVSTVRTPDHFQTGTAASLIALLTDGNPTTLGDSPNSSGPGDVAWAWEWDFTLAASGSGSSVAFSKDKTISTVIPEPTTILLLGSGFLGLVGAGAVRRRRLG